MPRKGDLETVHIATAPNETISEMWREALKDEGIVALVRSGGAGYSFGHNILNEQYIFVRKDQEDLAREIINDLESFDDQA